jgi:hypothetical protein
MAQRGLSANEIAPALISMMARSETLQSKAGYIDARPLSPYRRKSLATHGRTITLAGGHVRLGPILLKKSAVAKDEFR